MSLLTRVLIAKCAERDPPSADLEDSAADAFDQTERQGASPAQVVRTADRAGKGIRTVLGLPDRRGKYVFKDKASAPLGVEEEKFDFDSDPNRIMVSDMQKVFEEAADHKFGSTGSADEEDRKIFDRLEKEEERLELLSGSVPSEGRTKPQEKWLKGKCRARAVRGLIQLLASILWYLIYYAFMWHLALTGLYIFDSWIPIFEDHTDSKKERNGCEQRLQCEGDRWRQSLSAYLEEPDVTESLAKKREEEIELERNAAQVEASQAARKKQRRSGGNPGGGPKASQQPRPADPYQADPFLDHNVERKLRIGLDLALYVSKTIHEKVENSAPLATEPGCDCLDTQYKPHNSSLLLSVLRKLAPCPGRTGQQHKWWMGKTAVRLHAAQLRAVPPEGSAPEAGATQAGHGDGAAPPVDVQGSDAAEHCSSDPNPDASKVCGQLVRVLVPAWLMCRCTGGCGPGPELLATLGLGNRGVWTVGANRTFPLPRASGSCARAQAAPDQARRSGRSLTADEPKVCGRLANVTHPLIPLSLVAHVPVHRRLRTRPRIWMP